jgi:hypothetical protein
MKQIILINVLFSMLFLGCSTATVDYLPAVVYLKSPEIVNVDGVNKTYIEFSVSDLNELEGSVTLTVTDENNTKVLEKTINKILFSTDGTLVSFYENEITSSGKLNFAFNTCNKDDLCKDQSFLGVEINNSSDSDKINIEGQLNLENFNYSDISIYLSSKYNQLVPDKTDGKFSLEDLNAGSYDLYTEGKNIDDGFYRYIFLKSIKFNKNTKIYLYIPFDENQEYDEPIVSCSFSSNNENYLFILMLAIMLFLKFRINESKKL